MTIKLSNGNVVKWVGADTTKPETWSSIKSAADIDYLAFISLWDLGLITSSTYVWSATHCIEKYCKSLLIKNDSNINLKSYSHNTEKLWTDCKQYFNLVENELQLDEFIEELNSVQPSVRYGQNSIAVSSGLPAILIILGAILRKQIVGDEKYLENYGLAPSLFMPRPGTNEIQQDLKISKILHLYFEHNITFSGLSIPDTLDFMGIKVDTIDLKNNEVFKTCPWCNGYTLTGQAATFKLRIFLEDKEK